MYKWDKVVKSGLSKFFKGSLPQNLLSPLLNTLSQMSDINVYLYYADLWTRHLPIFYCSMLSSKLNLHKKCFSLAIMMILDHVFHQGYQL